MAELTQDANGGLSLPYAHLNLRFNPFGQMDRPSKNRICVLRMNVRPFIRRLSAPGYALQFLKEGAPNKTTTLLAIHRAFPGSVYIKLQSGRPYAGISQAPLLFIDRMDLMPLDQRRRIFARRCSFGIVSHINHVAEFSQAGLSFDLVKLPPYSAKGLKRQIDRRIAIARRDASKPVPAIAFKTVVHLLRRFGDDTQVIDYLYDVFEEIEDQGAVDVFD